MVMLKLQIFAVVFIFTGWIFSVCLHEFGHAIAAYWGGDTSVKEKGYLTLNPLKYTDPTNSIVLPLLFLSLGGIALPGAAVYIQTSRLRNKFWQSFVSLSGPIGSIVAIILFSSPFWGGFVTVDSPIVDHLAFSYDSLRSRSPNNLEELNLLDLIFPCLSILVIFNIFTLFFNLLPIPPLDGYGIIEPWLPRSLQKKLEKIDSILVAYLLFFFFPGAMKPLSQAARAIGYELGLIPELVRYGYAIFHPRYQGLLLIYFLLFYLVYNLARQSRTPLDIPSNLLSFIGHYFINIKKYKQALNCYDKAVEINPNAQAKIWHRRGWLLAKFERYEEALRSYDRAIQKSLQYHKPSLNQETADIWYCRAGVLRSLKRFEEAIQSYDEVIKLQPKNSCAYLLKGFLLWDTKQYQELILIYTEYLKLNPDHDYVEIWLYLEVAQYKLGQYEAAVESCRQLLKLKPKDLACWSRIVIMLTELKRYPEALEMSEKALKIAPNDLELQIRKGWILINLERAQDALNWAKECILSHPDDFYLLNLQGASYSRLGEAEKALETYDHALKLNSNHAVTWYNKACHYAEVENLTDALSHLKQALQLDSQLVDGLKDDRSFDKIRHYPEFQALLNPPDEVNEL